MSSKEKGKRGKEKRALRAEGIRRPYPADRSGAASGFVLFMVVVVMTLVGGLLAALALNVAALQRDRRIDRIRTVARCVGESAATYARTQADHWPAESPAQLVELDVKRLLPPGMRGSAILEFATLAAATSTDPASGEPAPPPGEAAAAGPSGTACRITVHVGQGAYEVKNVIEITHQHTTPPSADEDS